MTAEEQLNAARLATLEGRYADALAGFIWFHDHALEEDRSWYGVRLSFALSDWKELGDVYSPALEALREVRDRTSRSVRSGAGNREQFHDVESINQYLNELDNTRALFEALDKEHSALAVSCAGLAMESLVRTRAFTLASKYIIDPISTIEKLAESLNWSVSKIEDRPRSKSPRYDAYIHNFAAELNRIMCALSGANRITEALACRSSAFAVLKPWYVRKAIEKALAREA